jgi:hypothetical protein
MVALRRGLYRARVDLVAEAVQRLRDASLMPPVKSIEQIGRGSFVRTVISVSRPIANDVTNRIAEAMGSLHYVLREVAAGAGEDGIDYR